jgi:3-oxoacyl-[acyl-carrier-protein] synthase-3
MAVPDRRVANAEIAQQIGVTEDWISKRTGTSSRPWAEEGERMSDFAARAGTAALERAGLAPEQLDLVLVATSTSDEITPAAAPIVAGILGAEKAGAFDLGSACTGWLAGLAAAAGQVESGRAQHALVIGADFLSRFLDFSDRDTAALFADGAGAAVVSATPAGSGRIGPVVLHSDHVGADLIRLERGGRISMQGQETFRAAVSSLSAVTEEASSTTSRSSPIPPRPRSRSPSLWPSPRDGWLREAACSWAASGAASPGARRWCGGGRPRKAPVRSQFSPIARASQDCENARVTDRASDGAETLGLKENHDLPTHPPDRVGVRDPRDGGEVTL